ncbi:Histidine kinase [Rubrivivax sp. A210]|uniref:sensor histidine kinase n=1 Tax=Rubrivivax sp. A210 TaxID=2772301 RepID=UPI001919A639|nr:histidine kinase [Rubrivivax sp. A210]CAD5366999.1 Histidine kinase [Rubrivivax sp. A210]
MTPLADPASAPLHGPPRAAVPDLDLASLVMRRAMVVALTCLLALLVLGVLSTRTDTQREMEGSLDIARASQALARLREAPLADGLGRLQAMPGLRHLQMELRDESGQVVVRLADEESSAWLARQWRRLSSWLATARPATELAYGVPLQDGRVWSVTLTASPDSEILESASNLVGLFLLMVASCAAMLAAMRWSVRRSLRPLRTLVDAIAGVERHELTAVAALPAMPIRELEAIAQALRHLADAQARSEAARQVLAHRLMSLQEDERQRLARDLHDEFGQRLTALRVDASWLQRAGGLQIKAQAIVAGMGLQISLIQDDVRRLLARLRPLGVTPAGVDQRPQTLGGLAAMLAELAEGWSGRARGPVITLHIAESGGQQVLAQDLALGLYRITQEALTNVMRHADARRCEVEIALRDDGGPGPTLVWRVADDGRGIADLEAALRRGTGLAGLKERVWTLGGRFEASCGADCPGTALNAEFHLGGSEAA